MNLFVLRLLNPEILFLILLQKLSQSNFFHAVRFDTHSKKEGGLLWGSLIAENADLLQSKSCEQYLFYFQGQIKIRR